jgi:hypothetical protein
MPDIESVSTDVTGASAAPASIGDAVETATTTTEATDLSAMGIPVETTEPAAESQEDLTEPPANSSPEQMSRWKKLRHRAEMAESERNELAETTKAFEPIVPVRDEVVGLVDAMFVLDPDGGQVLDALASLDVAATRRLAAHVLETYGHVRDRDVYGADPQEIEAALNAYRNGGQIPASNLAPAYQPGGRLAEPQTTMPLKLQEEIEYLEGLGGEDAELANFMRQTYAEKEDLARRLQALESAPRQPQEQRVDPAVELSVKEEEFSRQFDPFVVEQLTAKGYTEPERASAFWDSVYGSIMKSPADRAIIEKAKALYVDGRKPAAAREFPAVKGVIQKHVNLRYAALNGTPAAAPAPTAAAAAAPVHQPGSSAPPQGGADKEPLRTRLERIFAGG